MFGVILSSIAMFFGSLAVMAGVANGFHDQPLDWPIGFALATIATAWFARTSAKDLRNIRRDEDRKATISALLDAVADLSAANFSVFQVANSNRIPDGATVEFMTMDGSPVQHVLELLTKLGWARSEAGPSAAAGLGVRCYALTPAGGPELDALVYIGEIGRRTAQAS